MKITLILFMIFSLSATGTESFADLLPKILQDTRSAENAIIRKYRPQFPFWSDGVDKRRWIELPEGSKINTNDMNRWVFPVGTKIWKEFSIGNRRIETRYFVKVKEGRSLDSWLFGTYLWDEYQKVAWLVAPEGKKGVAKTNIGVNYDVPSHEDCRKCHNKGGDPILGFDALQLAHEYDMNLEDLIRDKRLTANPESKIHVLGSTDEARAAYGYLHANCGHCHNPQGVASNAGLYFRYDVNISNEKDLPAFATAVDRLTRKFTYPGKVLGETSIRVRSKDPKNSAVVYLMSQRPEKGPQMPPIGTKAVDEHAVSVISAWIEQIDQ